MTIHPDSGVLSGTPEQWGRFQAQIQVSNIVGVVSRPLELVIQDTLVQWQQRRFTPAQLGQSSISGVTADPDQDGLVNGVEFALGTDPWEPEVEPPGTAGIDWLYGAEYLTLTSRLPDPPRAGVTYEWLGAGELGDWSPDQAVALVDERDPQTGARVVVHRQALPVLQENQGYLLLRIGVPSAP